ncbi:MAG: acyl-CoA dehydrogenase [Pseudonocardia sp.]|nr:acyl-CoA dehydrogenase [Pseudonocardia sp.]
MGLFGYASPSEWGGIGLDLIQDVELAQEFGSTALSQRSMSGTDNGIAGQGPGRLRHRRAEEGWAHSDRLL